MSYVVTLMSFIVNRLPTQPVTTFFNYFFTVRGRLLYVGRKSNPPLLFKIFTISLLNQDPRQPIGWSEPYTWVLRVVSLRAWDFPMSTQWFSLFSFLFFVFLVYFEWKCLLTWGSRVSSLFFRPPLFWVWVGSLGWLLILLGPFSLWNAFLLCNFH